MTVAAYAFLALAIPVLAVVFAICFTSSRFSREEEAAETIQVPPAEKQIVVDGRWSAVRAVS